MKKAMQFLVFILVYPLIWIISILPFPLLYLFSDFVYVLLYYVIGYRKQVVRDNLALAFPNKTVTERKSIEKKHFKHLADIFMEIIKTFTISEKTLAKHYTYNNLEIFDELKNQSVIIVGGHYNNWEWVVQLPQFIKHEGYAAYAKIESPYFEHVIKKSREKFGSKFIKTYNFIKVFEDNKANNILSATGLLSDQSPIYHKTKFWTKFMGTCIPTHVGAEVLAKKSNHAYLYFNVTKIKRGYYEVNFELITKTPNDYPDFELTEIFIRKLEKAIHKAPEYYFWTHKRWKLKDHKKQETAKISCK
jgi:KDO2-lipid IV(A) lauroyltransferase